VERVGEQRRELLRALNSVNEQLISWDELGSNGLRKVFIDPVDSTVAPYYYDVVKEPRDLTMIGYKIMRGSYSTAWQYLNDIHLMIDNAMLFNAPGTEHNRSAPLTALPFPPPAARSTGPTRPTTT
jgi:hypothetical protein